MCEIHEIWMMNQFREHGEIPGLRGSKNQADHSDRTRLEHDHRLIPDATDASHVRDRTVATERELHHAVPALSL